jgi:hypothetical protein
MDTGRCWARPEAGPVRSRRVLWRVLSISWIAPLAIHAALAAGADAAAAGAARIAPDTSAFALGCACSAGNRVSAAEVAPASTSCPIGAECEGAVEPARCSLGEAPASARELSRSVTADGETSSPPLPPPRSAEPFRAPNAIVLKVTERDLNQILRGTLRANGGPVFEGRIHNPSKGMTDLSYRVRVSDPVLKLGGEEQASISFSIREGHLDVGRYERKVAGRMAYCENLGVTVEPDKPVDVTIGVRFAIKGENLQIIPTKVSMPDAEKNFQLIKPSLCRHAPMPTWLLWWIGKPQLKKRLGALDSVLLASARKSAERLDTGSFWKQWDSGEEGRGGDSGGFYLYPDLLDTSHGSVFVSLSASDGPQDGARSPLPVWATSLSNRSFVAVSESFLDAAAGQALSRVTSSPRKSKGNLERLLKSDSVYALIPGLREVDSKDKIYLELKLASAPKVELRSSHRGACSGSPNCPPETGEGRPRGGEFGEIDGTRAGMPASPAVAERESPGDEAVILIKVKDLDLNIRQGGEGGDVLLGSLKVDSGRVGLSPYVNELGGVSFKIVENAWHVSSHGLEFNEELVEATIQEMIFAEAFETNYAPLLPHGLGIGDSRLTPQAIRVVGNHLVVEFSGL